jgi:hypothetical protein
MLRFYPVKKLTCPKLSPWFNIFIDLIIDSPLTGIVSLKISIEPLSIKNIEQSLD